MKKKNPNLFYGVSVDGLVLKVAEIEHLNDKVIVRKTASYKLESPLFNDYIDDSNLNLDSPNGNQEFTFNKPSNDEPDFENIDLFNENIDIPEKSYQQESVLSDNNANNLQSDSILKFFSQFDFKHGKISLSCLEGKAQWKLLRPKKKSSLNTLKKLAFTPEQLKDKTYNFDFVENPDNSYYAIIHQGEFEIKQLLDNIASTLNNKKSYYYQFIEPFEISILNIVNLFFNNEENLYTTILYIGHEAKLGIVVNGKKIVKNFPIMIYDTDPQKVREAVYAKIMLENETSDFPVIENIILCGDFASQEDIDFYSQKTGFNHRLFSPVCSLNQKECMNIEISENVDIKSVPSFVIPISLAVKGALPNNKNLMKFNLLPKRIIEAQKIFKIDWHGFLILLLLFIVTFTGTSQTLKNKLTLDQLKSRYNVSSNDLNLLKNFQTIIEGYQNQINYFQALNRKTADIANSKNSWSEIIYTLAEFSNRNPLCWVENLNYQENKLFIKGKSYHRNRITNLAQIFENGEIARINETMISGTTLWDFDLSFTKPKGNLHLEIQMPSYLKDYPSFIKHYEEQLKLKEKRVPAPVITASRRQLHTAPDFTTLYNEARDSYLSAEFDDTIRKTTHIIDEFPNHTDIDLVYYLLGETYYVIADFQNAVNNFNQVLRINKNKIAESLFFSAKAYEALSDYDQAINTYKDLIKRFPQNSLSKTAVEQLSNILGEYE